MSKRFKNIHIDSNKVVGLKDNGILKVGGLNELEDLLNELDMKNKRLQEDNERLKEELRLALN